MNRMKSCPPGRSQRRSWALYADRPGLVRGIGDFADRLGRIRAKSYTMFVGNSRNVGDRLRRADLSLG